MVSVSVIVPIFNKDRYLEECLTSISNQTETDIEIICYDDGSTDGSVGIARSSAERDPRITLVARENRGYGRTMNEAIARSRGTYVGIVEPDDLIDPNMYEQLLAAARTHGSDVVKCRYETIRNSGWHVSHNHRRRSGLIDADADVMLWYEHPCIWTGLYRRSFLLENEITFVETPGASFQDMPFWFETLLAKPRLFFVDEAYYTYRVHDGQSSAAVGLTQNYSIATTALERRLRERYHEREEFARIYTRCVIRAIEYYRGLHQLIPEPHVLFKDHVACVARFDEALITFDAMTDLQNELFRSARTNDYDRYDRALRQGFVQRIMRTLRDPFG